MNTTAAQRVDQIRVNLERLRWVAHDLEDEFVVTNIASFQTFLVRDRTSSGRASPQVGRFYRQTPVFTAKIKYMQFNPTWTVPPGILTNDILRPCKRISAISPRKTWTLLTATVTRWIQRLLTGELWSRSITAVPVCAKTRPTNALGRVKFIFPNKHFVFLHDTPSKALFERTERTFSSGLYSHREPLRVRRTVDGQSRQAQCHFDSTTAGQ